jgi:hypothetical protein
MVRDAFFTEAANFADTGVMRKRKIGTGVIGTSVLLAAVF